MKFRVVKNITLKTNNGDIELREGQTIEVQPEKVKKLIETGKLQPLPYITDYGALTIPYNSPQIEPEALNERMAIMGENCSPEQIEPYVTSFGVLVIPHNSPQKYHYWNGGQGVCDTLKELGRCDLIEKYKSIYCN